MSLEEALERIWFAVGVCENKNAGEPRCFVEAMNTVSEAIPQWVPTKECLPEKDGWYVVTIRYDFDRCKWSSVTINQFEADKGGFYDCDEKRRVLAWMPLPAMYIEPEAAE